MTIGFGNGIGFFIVKILMILEFVCPETSENSKNIQSFVWKKSQVRLKRGFVDNQNQIIYSSLFKRHFI